MAPALRDDLALLLSPTIESIAHQSPNPGAFYVDASAAGLDVLLVDDTFTTGARIQSAASALASAGARVVAAVPIGRVVDTSARITPKARVLEKTAPGRVRLRHVLSREPLLATECARHRHPHQDVRIGGSHYLARGRISSSSGAWAGHGRCAVYTANAPSSFAACFLRSARSKWP